MLAAERGAEQRAELHIARSGREGAAANDLGLGRAAVGEGGLGPPERGGGLGGGRLQRARSLTRDAISSAPTSPSLVAVSRSRSQASLDSRGLMGRSPRSEGNRLVHEDGVGA